MVDVGLPTQDFGFTVPSLSSAHAAAAVQPISYIHYYTESYTIDETAGTKEFEAVTP